MNGDKALESSILGMLPVRVFSFLKYRYSCLVFHFFGLEEKVSRVKRKLISSCLGIIYLALGISNPVGAKLSRLIPLAPTGIYVEIVRNVDIVSLAQNYPAGTSELFSFGANSALCKNSTLRRNSCDVV